MKKLKFFCFTLAAVAGLMLFSHVGAVTAQAAEPKSYAVKYDENSGNWLYQQAQESGGFDSSIPSSIVYYLVNLYLKDGDTIVVHNDSTADGSTIPMLDLGDVHLANLTYASPTWAIVKATSVDDLYVLGGTAGTFNGSVRNAYVYETSVFNFNNDVDTLVLGGLTDEWPTSTIGCSGTVHHFYAPGQNRTFYDVYDVASNKFSLSKGALITPDNYYTLSTDYVPPVAPEPAADTLAAPEATPAPTAAVTDDSAYDDVPKTGQSSLSWYLLCAGAFLAAGSLAVKRSCR